LAPVVDRFDGCLADELGEAADQTAGAVVQIGVERKKGAGTMAVQSQGLLQRPDHGLPLLAVPPVASPEGLGGDDGVPARDLGSPCALEQGAGLDVEPG